MFNRKIFYFSDFKKSQIKHNKIKLENDEISAAGILFYKKENERIYLLLIKYKDPNWPKLDDFGGRTDLNDQTVFDTMARETAEETNGLVNLVNLDLDGLDKTRLRYNATSKYLCYLKPISANFTQPSEFGDFEHADKIYRTIDWYDYDTILDDLAIRLNHLKRDDFV